MIVCGKCGFTQPKDVYCANCGINLEKYKPTPPKRWVRMAKDPLTQITVAIICGLAVFFILINKPSSQKQIATNTEASNNLNEEVPAAVEPSPEELKSSSKIIKKVKPDKTKIREAQKQFAKAKTSLAKTAEDENSPADAEVPLIGSFSFYEILPNQLSKYFTSSAKIQASIINSEELDLQAGNLSKIPIDGRWNLRGRKSYVFDYMLEPLDGSESQGIKISAKTNSSTESGSNISLKISANIPSIDGDDSSLEWSRSFNINQGKSVLIKIRLPNKEAPNSFLEENYNSLLSIMSNPQYIEQRLELLMHLKF